MNSQLKCWIEAMRLRTLPVSVAGVLTGVALAVTNGYFAPVPALLCLIFAILAQIASNFANEYYDFKAGLDKPGREGPRRGVTEGDITPKAMAIATYATLGAACVVGLCMVAYGGWWLIVAGFLIALGALSYSTGPYPLSRHALGEVTVVLFFGLVPVCLTYWLQTYTLDSHVVLAATGMGLLGANVLIVNNVRDRNADKAVGKNTLAVKLGRNVALLLYLVNGWVAMALMLPAWLDLGGVWWIVPVACCVDIFMLWCRIARKHGRELNPMLGRTSMVMFIVSLCLLIGALTNLIGA